MVFFGGGWASGKNLYQPCVGDMCMGGQYVVSAKEDGCRILAEVVKSEDVRNGSILQLNIFYVTVLFHF